MFLGTVSVQLRPIERLAWERGIDALVLFIGMFIGFSFFQFMVIPLPCNFLISDFIGGVI